MSLLEGRGCLALIARAAAGTGLLAFLAGAAGAQPALSNLTVSPPTTGSGAVRVSYLLSHPAARPCTVTLEGSRDNGATWGRLWALTGAVGAGVTTSVAGLPQTLTWNADAEWPAQRFPQARLRLAADDGSGSDTGTTVYVAVPAGVFSMGDPLDGIADAPLHQVNLAPYWLARTETTKAEWDEVRAWGLTHGYPDLPAAGGKAPAHPVQNMTWYDAVKWCNARSEQGGLTPAYYTTDAHTTPYRTGTLDLAPTQVRWNATGYRLPTEAEWERAARGGVAGRRFPLGNTISHEQANYASSANYAYDVSPTRGNHPAYATGAEPYTAPAGSFPPNGYGLVDMTGNVWEFCWDWFGPIAAAPATDPRGPPSGTTRVARGGGWFSIAVALRNAYRSSGGPGIPTNYTGFRTVRGLAPRVGSSTVISGAFELNLSVAPTLVTPPQSQTVMAGQSATLAAFALGSAPLTYVWRKDGVVIAGATQAALAWPAAQPADSGSYTVTVANPAGSIVSGAARLTVTRNYAGIYFGTFDSDRGNWALLVREDGVGTYVAYLGSPGGGILTTVTVSTDGRFRGAGVLIQPVAAGVSAPGRAAASVALPYTVTGTIGAATTTGTLEGPAAPFSGTQSSPAGATAAVSGLYQAGDTTTTTYVVVGPDRRVLALTVGATVVDGGLGAVGANGQFAVTTVQNTQIAGTVNASTGTVGATVSPPGGQTVTLNGALTQGLGPPVIAGAPPTQTVTAGNPVTLRISVGGRTPLAYQWRRNGAALPGATAATHAIAASQLDHAGYYSCAVANADGAAVSEPAGLTVVVAGALFPPARLVNLSIRTALRVADDFFALGYVVGGDGVAGPKPFLIRAAGPSLALLGVAGALDDPQVELFAGGTRTGENDNWGGGQELASAFASVGAFPFGAMASRDAAVIAPIATKENSVRVSASGSGTGEVLAELYDAAQSRAAAVRLVNVSVLKHLGTGLIAGFVIGGSGSKTVLVRAIGPTLGEPPFGVAGAVADPQLALYAGEAVLGANDNWGGSAELTAAFASVGAFALPAASRDAALLATLPPGAYTVQVSGVAGATGLALVEVYEVR